MTRPSWTLSASLLAASTLTIMAGATIAPALPGMAAAFAATPGAEMQVRLVLTITALAIALAAPLMGLAGDRLGRRRVLIAAVTLYVLAGSAGLVLDDLTLLLASRVLLGLAVAGIMTATAGLIGDLYDGADRARMLGLQGAAMGFGGVVFLGLGGVLAELSWRGPFALYLLPLVLILALPGVLPKGTRAALVAADGDDATPVPGLAVIYGAAFLAMVGFYALPVQFPFLLAARGWPDPILSGVALAGLTLTSALVSLGSTRLFGGGDPARFAPLTFALIGAGLLTIAASEAPGGMALGLVLTGAGMGLLMPVLSGWLLRIAPAPRRGRIMGGLTSALFLGQFASPVVLQPVIDWAGLPAAFAAAGLLPLLLAAVFLARRRMSPCRPAPQSGP